MSDFPAERSMTALTIERLQVAGFKTIQQLDLELRPINVLIGANGTGKSI